MVGGGRGRHDGKRGTAKEHNRSLEECVAKEGTTAAQGKRDKELLQRRGEGQTGKDVPEQAGFRRERETWHLAKKDAEKDIQRDSEEEEGASDPGAPYPPAGPQNPIVSSFGSIALSVSCAPCSGHEGCSGSRQDTNGRICTE